MLVANLRIAALTLVVLSTQTAGADDGRERPWLYVAPEAGVPGSSVSVRALPLSNQRPDDVVERAAFRGTRQRYAQIRFGSPNSVRVTVVLDEIDRQNADLYVDSDRNRRIEARDLVSPKESARGEWELPLHVAIVEGELTRFETRHVLFRRGATGVTLGYAAQGDRRGLVQIDSRECAARLFDADGDGLYTTMQDRVAIDLDGNREFDPVSEHFLLAPLLSIRGVRHAVRLDPEGRSLALEPIVGSGALTIAPQIHSVPAQGAEVAILLVGRDGAAVGLKGIAPLKSEIPPGDYRVSTLTVGLSDPSGGMRWNYVFSDNGRRGEPVWHRVENGQNLVLDPLGKLEFDATLEPNEKTVKPGQDLRINPRLYTADGLLIVTCFQGNVANPSSDSGPRAIITLADRTLALLANTTSGFA
jgi:hypothetical protein